MTMDHADKRRHNHRSKVQESALTESRAILAATQAALVISREEERDARRRALHDSMTGLANRDLFDDRLSSAISLARRHDWILAVMFLDLDGFKQINDTHGHATGDDVLKEVARRLSLRSRDEDTVCRNGGDEFLYLLVDPQGRENIERIASMICTNIAQPMAIGSLQLSVAASMGVAIYPARWRDQRRTDKERRHRHVPRQKKWQRQRVLRPGRESVSHDLNVTVPFNAHEHDLVATISTPLTEDRASRTKEWSHNDRTSAVRQEARRLPRHTSVQDSIAR